ncbi:MAG TPA: lysophospholipid acyltransferase family protein [Gammaproteobacteria bacterium]
MVYGIYAWLALLAIALPVAVAFAFTPGVLRRRRLAHHGAGLFLAVIGSRPRIKGRPAEGPCVVVANHASYLDGIILTAALPPRFSFLIKHEMARIPVAGFVLRGLGSQFVDRTSAGHRHRTARRLVAEAASGAAFAVFPEGTFDREPGLGPFQLGAFVAARRAGTAIVPVAITGARRKLPARSWLPAPGPITVWIGTGIPSSDYADARTLAAATRAEILTRLGEPDAARKSRG